MDYSELDTYIDTLGAERVVEGIAPFLSDTRRAAIERVVGARLASVQVAIEQPEDPYNAAAVVRTAEALGVLNVHVVGAPEGTLHARKTTQGSFNWLHTRHHAVLSQLVELLQQGSVRLFGAAPAATCVLDELPVDAPFCLLFGNEASGLSTQALALCEQTFRIPMLGMSESLNLSVSAAIALYATTRARRLFLAADSDLDAAAKLRERARYYARSVDIRLLQAL